MEQEMLHGVGLELSTAQLTSVQHIKWKNCPFLPRIDRAAVAHSDAHVLPKERRRDSMRLLRPG